MTSGFVSGIIAGTITTPIDRLLPVIQQNNPPKNIAKWFRDSIREKGLRSVFAGTGARVLHAGWNTCFVFELCIFLKLVNLLNTKAICQFL